MLVFATFVSSLRLIVHQALNHPYFFALPYPTHPSKLPKTSAQIASSRALENLEGNVDLTGPGPAVKAAPPNARLKRKMSDDDGGRNIARRLDFTQQIKA
jgi:cyclin-dependent kinase 7